jgi:hypothetical protein
MILGMDTSTSSTTHSMMPNVDEEKDKKVSPTHSRVQVPSTQVLDQIICSHSKGVMQKELNNFTRNDVWVLEPPPKNKNNIGTKWAFRNKEDKYGLMVHNKARLVVKEFSQVEGSLRCPYGELQAKQDIYDH